MARLERTRIVARLARQGPTNYVSLRDSLNLMGTCPLICAYWLLARLTRQGRSECLAFHVSSRTWRPTGGVSPVYSSVAVFSGQKEVVFSFPTGEPPSCRGVIVAPVNRYGVSLGRIELCPSWSGFLASLAGSAGFLLVLVLLGGLISVGAMLPLLRYRTALKKLLVAFKTWSQEPGCHPLPELMDDDPINVRIAAMFKDGVENQLAADREIAKREKDREIALLAKQVSHDICSPLASLEMMLDELPNVPEHTRSIVKSAVTHIKDIAGDLLNKSAEMEGLVVNTKLVVPNRSPEEITCEMLGLLIDDVISRKQSEYRKFTGLEIEFNLGSNEYGLFADVHRADFERVLSNLINNSVAACGGLGGIQKVQVRLEMELGRVLVIVEDKGKGMTPEALANIGKTGNGLGLPHAKRCVDRWSGILGIESRPGLGTMVRISLPRATPPKWFAPRVMLPATGRVVILDDQESAHAVWDIKFEQMPEKTAAQIVHLKSAAGFRAWFGANAGAIADSDSLFLMDCQLTGEDETGLDLIEDFGIAAKSILVTGSDEPEIFRRCERLGVRLLPKGALWAVTVSAASSTSTSAEALINVL